MLHTGSSNVILGKSAGQAGGGSFNVFAGFEAGLSAQDIADYNVCLGSKAGRGITTADSSIFIGSGCGSTGAVTGSPNDCIGYECGKSLTSGASNTFFGYKSGTSAQTTAGCSILGYNSGIALQAGDESVFVGSEVGPAVTTCHLSVLMGHQTGLLATAVDSVVAIGQGTVSGVAAALTTAVYIGTDAGKYCNAGGGYTSSHVVVGWNAGKGAAEWKANDCVLVGTSAGEKIQTGASYNTAIGPYAMQNLTTGSENTCIGARTAATLTTGTKNVIVGSLADVSAANATNQMVIGNNSVGVADNSCVAGDINMGGRYFIYGSSGVWNNVSDVRLKTDIQDIDLGLSFVRKLKPVTFRFKANPTDLQRGFIADDVAEALKTEPQARPSRIVHEMNDEQHTKVLCVDNIFVAHVQATKDLDAIVQELAQMVSDLKSRKKFV
jgi:hypothetical protein